MRKVTVRIDGPCPTVKASGTTIRRLHFVIQRPTYGRILFTDYCGLAIIDPMIRNTVISHCYFEGA